MIKLQGEKSLGQDIIMSCNKVSATCEVQVLESNILWKPGEHVIYHCYLLDYKIKYAGYRWR